MTRKEITGSSHSYAVAMGALGMLYGYGQGVPKDLNQAAFWLKKAALTGDALTQKASREQLQKLGLSQ